MSLPTIIKYDYFKDILNIWLIYGDNYVVPFELVKYLLENLSYSDLLDNRLICHIIFVLFSHIESELAKTKPHHAEFCNQVISFISEMYEWEYQNVKGLSRRNNFEQ